MAVDLSDARRRLSSIVDEWPPDALPDLLGELARAEAIASERLHRPPAPSVNGRPAARPDRYISAAEVAEWLGVKPNFVYAHAKDLGVLRLSNRCVRFSPAAVMRFITAHRQ